MKTCSLPLALAALALSATLAVADPEFIIRYPNGVPQVSIAGDYSGASYTVWRAPAHGGVFERITRNGILCLGSCYAEDRTTVAGETYRYRFDLVLSNDDAVGFVSYGPFLATISPALARPLGVYAFPNPGRGATSVQLHVAGAATDRAAQGEASIFDLTGRRVRVLHRGAIARGLTSLTWDGRDERGGELKPGVYLLRLAADGRQANALLVRR
jgi:hypothetical protein